MTHVAAIRRARRRIYSPGIGCCPNEENARGGARLPQRHPGCAHDGASAGVLRAIALLVEISLLHRDPLPLGLELLGDEHRDRRARALPHLRPRNDHYDAAVRLDSEESVRQEGVPGCRWLRTKGEADA